MTLLNSVTLPLSETMSVNPTIQQRIEEWQFIYNYKRSHGGLGGKTPAGKIADVGERNPMSEVVVAAYD